MHLRKLLPATAVVIAAAALAPAGAAADTQAVSGTTVAATLALGVPVAATFGTSLGPTSTVDTTGGGVAVTAVGPWVMRVDDASVNAGKMVATTANTLCTGSTPVLNNALRIFSTAALGNFTAAGTTGAPLTLSGTATQIASGTGSNTVTLTYRHIPSTSDQLTAGCPYTLTDTVALAAT